MRLPQQLLESRWFLFDSLHELLAALDGEVDSSELIEVAKLSELGLPPIASREALGTMIGVNPGFVWSLEQRSRKQYRSFSIKSGKKERIIFAPKIGIKVIQKWIGWQLQKSYDPPSHVFGFIPGRSHITAAQAHCGADWIFSNDIKDFFPTTPQEYVVSSLIKLGFTKKGAELIGGLCCLNGALSQGSPASPVLSNLAFSEIDVQLAETANRRKLTLTRYADDIVFSGIGSFPSDLENDVQKIFEGRPWQLSLEKRNFTQSPNRLKVHGLLVNGPVPRLTKGYRNRIRAYKHLRSNGKVKFEDMARIKGHLEYARQVDSIVDVISLAPPSDD